MPWKECHIVEERLRFIARLLDGEKMAGLCREFGIARKTGGKIYNRYKDCGIGGLTDRSRRPYRHVNQLPMQIEKLIVKLLPEQYEMPLLIHNFVAPVPRHISNVAVVGIGQTRHRPSHCCWNGRTYNSGRTIQEGV